MEKINIGNNVFLLPMPMVLVGSRIKGRPNFMAVVWVNRVKKTHKHMRVALGEEINPEGCL